MNHLGFMYTCRPIWRTSSKQCKSCQHVKPLDEFYEQKGMLHGRRAICKVCWNKRRAS